jgi:hypothetical protein
MIDSKFKLCFGNGDTQIGINYFTNRQIQSMSKDLEKWFDVARGVGVASSEDDRNDDSVIQGKITSIRDYVNKVKTRCTYNTAAEALGIKPVKFKKLLGDRKSENSWFVNAGAGEPVGYADNEKHADLYRTTRIITSAEVLTRNLDL